MLDMDSNIEQIIFEWSFQYEEVMNIRDVGRLHVILYVEDNEWANVIMPLLRWTSRSLLV